MTDDRLDALDALADAWAAAAQTAAARKQALFGGVAAAMRTGHTATEVADRIAANRTPEQLALGLTFTPAYLRRIGREAGVPPQSPGPRRSAGRGPRP